MLVEQDIVVESSLHPKYMAIRIIVWKHRADQLEAMLCLALRRGVPPGARASAVRAPAP